MNVGVGMGVILSHWNIDVVFCHRCTSRPVLEYLRKPDVGPYADFQIVVHSWGVQTLHSYNYHSSPVSLVKLVSSSLQ